MLEAAAEQELSYRQGRGKFGSIPYTAQEIGRANPMIAEKLKELELTDLRYQELRSTSGINHPTVFATKQRLEIL